MRYFAIFSLFAPLAWAASSGAASGASGSSSPTTTGGSSSSSSTPVFCENPLTRFNVSGEAAICLTDAFVASGCDSVLDSYCLCNSESYLDSSTECILANAPQDQHKIISLSVTFCSTKTPAPTECGGSGKTVTAKTGGFVNTPTTCGQIRGACTEEAAVAFATTYLPDVAMLYTMLIAGFISGIISLAL